PGSAAEPVRAAERGVEPTRRGGWIGRDDGRAGGRGDRRACGFGRSARRSRRGGAPRGEWRCRRGGRGGDPRGERRFRWEDAPRGERRLRWGDAPRGERRLRWE